LVSWKGYGPSDNTWEPATHVANAPRLLRQFHATHPSKPGPLPSLPE
jgi:hypothetical protein